MIKIGSMHTATIALVAGLVGGMLSGAIIQGHAVQAEQGVPESAVIAHEFRVVEKDGTVKAVIGRQPDGKQARPSTIIVEESVQKLA